MATYYTEKDGKIDAMAAWPFCTGALKTDRTIVRGRDGRLYFEDEVPTQMQHMDELARIKVELEQLDLDSIRPIRAILRGNPAPEEMEQLDSIGARAEELRKKLMETPE